MKRFLIRFFLLIIYVIAVQFALPILVDPFNVFHYENIRMLPTEPNKNYIKMRYILNNPEKFSGFIFGSSRVGNINPEKMPNKKIYNMTYSMGIPEEHLANIKTMLRNNIHPSVIYIGLDAISVQEKKEKHILQPLRCPYEYLVENTSHFYSLYLNPLDTLRALYLILTRPKLLMLNHKTFYNLGWNGQYGFKGRAELGKEKYTRDYGDEMSDRIMIEQVLKIIRETVNLCRKNNIELILFTNPMFHVTHMKAMDRNYSYFLSGLSDISDFWNFSGLNDITLSADDYLDISHYCAEVGDLIIDIMCNGKSYPELQRQGFGVKVTRENVKEFISMLKQQAEEYEKLHH